jgi:hypothetical protein
VIQAPKPEPRIMRYELTDHDWGGHQADAAEQAARCPTGERPPSPVGVEPGAVIALDRVAVDQDVAATMCADMPERNGLERPALTRSHGIIICNASIAFSPRRVV